MHKLSLDEFDNLLNEIDNDTKTKDPENSCPYSTNYIDTSDEKAAAPEAEAPEAKADNPEELSFLQRLVLSLKGPKFDISSFIGCGRKASANFNKERKISYDKDPGWFINKLVGVWSGKLGVDTVLVPPFQTAYEESVVCSNLIGNVFNPHGNSQNEPAGELIGGEEIFGVRYYRTVTAIQEASNKSTNPFLKGTPIHEEVGYILFCYIGTEDKENGSGNGSGKNDVKFKLSRIVTTVSIPRGVTVNAHCERSEITFNKNKGNFNNGELKYTAVAGDFHIPWNVVSSSFLWQGGRIPKFDQKNVFNFKERDGIGSTWKYKQETPFFFPAHNIITWEHNNENTLTKISIKENKNYKI